MIGRRDIERAAQVTGFAHLDGPLGAPWPPPRPRGVLWASVLFLLLAAAMIAATFAVIAAIAFTCALTRACPAIKTPSTPALLMIVSVLLAAPFVIQAWLRDKRPPPALGLTARGWRAAFVFAAAAIAFSLPLVAWAVTDAGRPGLAGAAAMAILTSIPVFAIQGGSEEILCRGWLMQTIAARHGALAALIASSLFFALLHLDPRETMLGMIVGVAARLPLAFALGLLALRQGNLWGSLGLHAGWNAGQFALVSVTTAASGKSPWDALLDAESRTTIADLANAEFVVTMMCMLALLAFVWAISGNVRARLAQPALAETRETSL
jgi:membrane protease YdiL (CAAX protease family)